MTIPIPITGKAVVVNRNRPNELSVGFFGEPNLSQPNYIVLDTDYTSYSLVYSCTQSAPSIFSSGKTEYAWILSRQKTLDQATVQRLENMLTSIGVDRSKLLVTNQSCRN